LRLQLEFLESGPAYVFIYAKYVEAAFKYGFSATNDSKVLVSQTLEGAVDLFNNADLSPILIGKSSS